jgi:hypothetical protein
MPSAETYAYLLRKGYPVNQCAYNRFDALESDSDITGLFEVLGSVKDRMGMPAVITANWIAANPDFDRIRSSGFMEYFWEESTTTLQNYPGSGKVVELQRKGIEEGLFYPQFHGREHVHVLPWMEEIAKVDGPARQAFDQRMISFNNRQVPSCEADFMDAYNALNSDDLTLSCNAIKEGAKLFEKTWGFTSKTTIPPCYYWHAEHEIILANEGVELIQGIAVQKSPVIGQRKWRKKYHWTGQRNTKNQFYSRRNIFFEPSLTGSTQLVEHVLSAIDRSFKNGQPAIISSHRLNYTGTINPTNRADNLKLLKDLLKQIVQRHPDIEFMHSAQFLEVLKSKNV